MVVGDDLVIQHEVAVLSPPDDQAVTDRLGRGSRSLSVYPDPGHASSGSLPGALDPVTERPQGEKAAIDRGFALGHLGRHAFEAG